MNRTCTVQRRIQDFPDGVCVGGGGRNTRGGAPIFYSTKFLPKLHENERNWTGGGGVSLAPSREGEIFNPPPFTVADPGFLGLGRGKFMTPFHQPIAYHEI